MRIFQPRQVGKRKRELGSQRTVPPSAGYSDCHRLAQELFSKLVATGVRNVALCVTQPDR